MGTLRCPSPSPRGLPPSNWEAPKVLTIDFMRLAGEKGWFRPRNKVLFLLPPPEAAAAKQHFDREVGRHREGYHTLLWQRQDPVCCNSLEIFSPPSDVFMVDQHSGVGFFRCWRMNRTYMEPQTTCLFHLNGASFS